MNAARLVLIPAGAAASVVLALGSVLAHGDGQIAQLVARADRVLAGSGITARFAEADGRLTRHPILLGGEALPDDRRAALAAQVAGIAGIGGVRWATRSGPVVALASGSPASGSPATPTTPHCQQDVNAVLKARSLRFAEASARIDPASLLVLDEVAAALRPCAGSVIAIGGHTDSGGDEAANLELSQRRAEAVRTALIARGIAAADLRARGWGSQRPLPDLEPADPANRRIEFAVITIKAVQPTMIDRPGPG